MPRILVVDDETSLRETFHFFLTREGYAPVLTASGYEQALAMIRSEKIDLIISDIVRHRQGGLDSIDEVSATAISPDGSSYYTAADLDEAAAMDAKRRAEEALAGQQADFEYARAQAELAEAVAQLRAIERLRKLKRG